MIRLRLTLNNLPTNSKRILEFLEYSAEEVTMADVGRTLGLNSSRVIYAMGFLRKHNLVKQRRALGVKLSANYLSVNAETVARSDINEMIYNV